MLLDTSIIASFLKPGAAHRSPKLVAFVDTVIRTGSLEISVITEFELRRGVEELVLKGQGRRRLVALSKFLEQCEILGLDGGGWDLAAKLWAKGRAQKPALVISDADLIIATTASFHRRPFATADARLVANLAKLEVTDVTLLSDD